MGLVERLIVITPTPTESGGNRALKFLGQIVLLRVENAQVKHEDLATWFDELELDRHFLPARTSPVNAFKKGATGPQTRLGYDAPWVHPTATATVKWEDESHDAERIVRRAMRSTRVQQKAGEPQMVAKVTFYKRNRRATDGNTGEKMRFQLVRERLDPAETPIIEQWMVDAQRRYEAGQVWVDTDALRGVARDYLIKRLKALMVRPAVYFVYRELEGEMKRLEDLVLRFGGECMFHPIEFVDREANRALLARALDNTLEGDATVLQRDLRTLRAKYPRVVPQSAFAPMVTRYEDIMTMAHEYAEAVGVIDHAGLESLTEAIVAMRKAVRRDQ